MRQPHKLALLLFIVFVSCDKDAEPVVCETDSTPAPVEVFCPDIGGTP